MAAPPPTKTLLPVSIVWNLSPNTLGPASIDPKPSLSLSWTYTSAHPTRCLLTPRPPLSLSWTHTATHLTHPSQPPTPPLPLSPPPRPPPLSLQSHTPHPTTPLFTATMQHALTLEGLYLSWPTSHQISIINGHSISCLCRPPGQSPSS